MPFHLPVDVYFDDVIYELEISGGSSIEGYVYVCDEDENILGYAPSLESVISIPSDYTGLLLIYIESESWYATGEFAI